VFPPRHNALDGVRVALLESRMAGELAHLVRRYGGVVRSAPAVREVSLDCAAAVTDFLNRVDGPGNRVHVFLTGAGATALFDEAQKQGRLPALTVSLKSGTIVCRGPKPTAALKRYGISPHLVAASPYTSLEVLDAIAGIDVAGAEVSVVHYGERSEVLAGALRTRGAILHELYVYEWQLPHDIVPMQDLVHALGQREVDAIVFTSQVQWKHLRRVAAPLGLGDALIDALNRHTVVAAIGPICSEVLAADGVRPVVVPDNPKMGPLVTALAQHFSGRSSATSIPAAAE
jgi:uroporphyrinogen-III synthase